MLLVVGRVGTTNTRVVETLSRSKSCLSGAVRACRVLNAVLVKYQLGVRVDCASRAVAFRQNRADSKDTVDQFLRLGRVSPLVPWGQ